MGELARQFVEASRLGMCIELGDYSATALAELSADLADTPESAELFRTLSNSHAAACQAEALSLTSNVTDPGVAAEIVRLLPASTQQDEGFARRLHTVLLARSEDSGLHYATRAQLLLGALYLSQKRPPLLRKLQAHLLDIDLEDDEEYLRHVARIAGLVLTHVQDDELLCMLEALVSVPGAEDEAAFVLGQLAVATALDTHDRPAALAAFHRAHDYMQRAIAASEHRQDAALYQTCLNVLLTFQEGRQGSHLGGMLVELSKAAFEYAACLLPSDRQIDRDSWLGASLLEGLRWSELATRLAQLDVSLLKKAWLNASRVIEEELCKVFEASRSILLRTSSGGIEALVRPRIAGSIQKNTYQLDVLDQWLEENSDSLDIPIAMKIRADITSAMEAAICRNPTKAAAAPATAAEILAQTSLPAELAANATRTLEAAILTLDLAATDPFVVEIFESLHEQLLNNPDYRQGDRQQFFIQILYYTLSFVASRENQTPSAVTGIDYLFNRSTDHPPIEADLHKDYFGFLQATPLRELTQREATGVAHGRVDVHFTRNAVKTVAELKKTHEDLTLIELVDKFGLQTTAYQRTNVTFCILMVLDLADRGGGSDHLRNLATVRQKTPPSGNAEYSVVVLRVQGRKRPPSYL